VRASAGLCKGFCEDFCERRGPDPLRSVVCGGVAFLCKGVEGLRSSTNWSHVFSAILRSYIGLFLSS